MCTILIFWSWWISQSIKAHLCCEWIGIAICWLLMGTFAHTHSGSKLLCYVYPCSFLFRYFDHCVCCCNFEPVSLVMNRVWLRWFERICRDYIRRENTTKSARPQKPRPETRDQIKTNTDDLTMLSSNQRKFSCGIFSSRIFAFFSNSYSKSFIACHFYMLTCHRKTLIQDLDQEQERDQDQDCSVRSEDQVCDFNINLSHVKQDNGSWCTHMIKFLTAASRAVINWMLSTKESLFGSIVRFLHYYLML